MIAAFDPVGLDELVDRAALLTRTDRKYVLPASRLDEVLTGLLPHARALEIAGARDFGYASTYYDDPGLTSFHLSAHGRRRRFKVRSRTYAESGQSFLEVKTRGARGATVKQRQALMSRPGTWGRLPAETLDLVQRTVADHGLSAEALEPVLHTSYRRSTLLLPGCGARMTVDAQLVWALRDGRSVRLEDVVVVETKSGARASFADRHLWAHGVRPTRISKYGTGLTALDDRVRGNRWHSVLRRHLHPGQPAPTSSLDNSSDRTPA